MSFNIFDDPSQRTYFILLLVSAVIAIVAIALRFVATSLSRRKPALEDWLALAAVIVFLSRVGVAFNALRYINGRGTELAKDKKSYENAFKMIFIADVITLLDQCFAKWSICALYYRLFSVKRGVAIWIQCIAAVQFVLYIVLVIMQSFQCRPLNKFWQWWAPGHCMPFSTLLVAIDPLNSLIDFALVVLAVFAIRSLRLKPGAKWKLRFLFGLGGLAGVVGFIKVGLAYSPDTEYTTAAIAVWAVVQSVVSIVCCCAPIYKPLFPKSVSWTKLMTRFGVSRSNIDHNRPTHKWGWARLYGSSTNKIVATNPPRLPYMENAYALGSISVRASVAN